ncbi:hypothetical protein ACFQH5_16920 [Halomonas salifodinae]|uniref:Uncharacterized protein n=1 Tax=Halomonas salifodinae TaxID=438745 RepID=A0ABW2F2D3_9GAMM
MMNINEFSSQRVLWRGLCNDLVCQITLHGLHEARGRRAGEEMVWGTP